MIIYLFIYILSLILRVALTSAAPAPSTNNTVYQYWYISMQELLMQTNFLTDLLANGLTF